MSLKDQLVVITGGGTGIGLGVALAMNKAGAKVVIGGRRIDALQTAAQAAVDPHPITPIAVDVADRASVNHFFDQIHSQMGQIDILVNAAGINIKNRSMDQMQPEQWDQVMAINATGAYNCLYAVLPSMRQRKSGLIINISSVAGKRAIALGGVAYAASKFAMTALGTCVGNEVNADGVRVTNVYPGEVDTPILQQRPTPITEDHRQRILQPEDVAEMIVAIAQLPPRAHVPEIIIKPVTQGFF